MPTKNTQKPIWPWPLTSKFNRVLDVVEIHAHVKFHQAKCSGWWPIVLTEKKQTNSATMLKTILPSLRRAVNITIIINTCHNSQLITSASPAAMLSSAGSRTTKDNSCQSVTGEVSLRQNTHRQTNQWLTPLQASKHDGRLAPTCIRPSVQFRPSVPRTGS